MMNLNEHFCQTGRYHCFVAVFDVECAFGIKEKICLLHNEFEVDKTNEDFSLFCWLAPGTTRRHRTTNELIDLQDLFGLLLTVT